MRRKNFRPVLENIPQLPEQESEKNTSKKRSQLTDNNKHRHQQETEKKQKQETESKTMGSMYLQHTKTYILDDLDPVTLENIKEDNEAYIMRIGLKGFQPYQIETAYELYVKKNMKNVTTRQEVPQVQKARIELYKQFHDKFPKYSYDASHINKLFLEYLDNNGKIPDDDLLELKRFMFFDMADSVFSGLGVSSDNMTATERLQFRNIATSALSSLPYGSWIVRPSSIPDDTKNHIYVRIVSVNRKGGIYNIPIIHVWGYGYIVTQDLARGQSLSGFNFEKAHGLWFPSLIDVLSFLATKFEIPIILPKYYRVPKSSYSNWGKNLLMTQAK